MARICFKGVICGLACDRLAAQSEKKREKKVKDNLSLGDPHHAKDDRRYDKSPKRRETLQHTSHLKLHTKLISTFLFSFILYLY